MTESVMLIIILVLAVLIAALLIMDLIKTAALQRELRDTEDEITEEMREMREDLSDELRQTEEIINREIDSTRKEVTEFTRSGFKAYGDMVAANQKSMADIQDRRLEHLEKRMASMSMQSDRNLENIRKTIGDSLDKVQETTERRLSAIQEENSRSMEKIRETVDEKLQKTLEDRISQSFKLVSERLEEVYKGLGEMQNLASGVGDLKKVLSNVKTRGILGEIQLGAILDQILSPEQYDEDTSVVPGAPERVEYAVRIPVKDGEFIYLPIDAKFPGDAYSNLMDAYENGDVARIEECSRMLERAINKAAKDISDKYIRPPYTTDFAIMFLPFEGLYAEVVRRGMLEQLQKKYHVNIAGPTTMAALLNSLQMSFRAFAIQEHSGEVWKVLGAVRSEFDKFQTALTQTQKHILQAHDDLEKMVGVRTRQVQKALQKVEAIPDQGDAAIKNLLSEGKDTE